MRQARAPAPHRQTSVDGPSTRSTGGSPSTHRPISCFGPAIGPHPGSLPGPFPCPPGDGSHRTVPGSGGGPHHQEIAHVRVIVDACPAAVHRHLPAIDNAARYRLPPPPPAGPRGGAGRGPRRRLERLGRPARAGARTPSPSASPASPATPSGTSSTAAGSATEAAAAAAMDIFHLKAQAACGFKVVSLDSDAERWPGRGLGTLERVAGLRQPGRPGRRGGLPGRLRGWLAGLPARKRRVAELLAEGHERGRRGPPRRDLAGAGQPTADGAGRELAGVPGRGDSGSDRTRLIDRHKRTRSEEDGPLVRPAQAQ